MDANGRQFFPVVFVKSLVLLASQKFASLNSFAGNVAGLRAEIMLINRGLPSSSQEPAPATRQRRTG